MNLMLKSFERFYEQLKRVLLLILSSIIFSTALVEAQTQTIYTQNIKLENSKISLRELFNKIEKQSNFLFFYVDSDIEGISIKPQTNKTISETLDHALKGTSLSYIVNDRHITISKKKSKEKSNELTTSTISGIVKDPNGETVIGANIIVKGTTNGTITDVNGKFSLIMYEKDVIVVSYIGYEKQEITIGKDSHIIINLKEVDNSLDEVVVVGYGSLKKRDLTGAVSSVKSDDLQKTSSVSVGQMLSGKAAGLQVVQNSAQPGGGISFLIRGAASTGAGNAPLIIIDGFPISTFTEPGSGNAYDGGAKSDLNSINPNDIESVEILKDASATAIYGARASNGVILITTKRGKEGRIIIEYNGGYSKQSIADKYEIMSASELMSTINMYRKENYLLQEKIYPYGTIIKTEQEINQAFRPTYSIDQIANPEADTNWFDLITRQGAISQHNISARGGSKTAKYLISFNYYDQKGVVKNSGLERYSGRINIDQELNRFLSFGISATASRINNFNSQLGGGGNELSGIIRSALTFPTYLPVYNSTGEYSLSPTQNYLPNPVSLLEISDQSIMERLLLNNYAELTPFTNMKVRGSIGIDRNSGKRYTYLPKTTFYGVKEGGKASINNTDRIDLLANIVTSYNTTFFEKNSITVMAGYEYQRFQLDGMGASNNDFLLDSFLWYNLSAGEAKKPTVFSSGSVETMASYFSRINVSLYDRFLLTGTFRADGSSKFARNKKWGYFPSMAFAWRLSEERFMDTTKDFLSNLKIRLSYGSTGNANIGHNAFAAYRTGQNFQFGDKVHTGVFMSQIENPNLSWETTTEFNLGMDFGLFKNRINGSVELFTKTIHGLLSVRNLPTYNEITLIPDNIGKTQSKGIELTLNSTPVQTKDFNWNTTLTFSLYRDRWLERAPTWVPSIYQSENDYIRNNFFYKSDGLIQSNDIPDYMPTAVPGQVKLLDINGFEKDADGNRLVDAFGKFIYSGKPDGVLDEADIVDFGNADPGYMIGFNNTFVFKGFDLNIYLYGFFDRLMTDPNSSIGINHQLGQHQDQSEKLCFLIIKHKF
jgi:TonB-linked SusC/RagA family outer membrane protein